jgi:hypothetical protein
MADRGFSNDELALYELLQQFLALSDSTEVAGRIILLGSNGAIVGDASLATSDIEAAAGALLKLNIQRADAVDPVADPLAEDDVTDKDVTDVVTAFEKLLGNGGQA